MDIECNTEKSINNSPILFLGVDRGTTIAVRVYNYQEVEKGGVVVPAKMEFFIVDLGLVIQHRIVKMIVTNQNAQSRI